MTLGINLRLIPKYGRINEEIESRLEKTRKTKLKITNYNLFRRNCQIGLKKETSYGS